jgi:2-polyprenyl-6-methoxyphenol hydroxylase-like FAD-dependent oxidoreductase
MTGGRCICLRPDPHPAGRVRAMLLNVTTKSDLDGKARLDRALGEGSEGYKRLLEKLYADGGWLAPQIIQGMRESEDFYCSQFAQVRSPQYQSGRVVLLGDAGYATPGLGTSLAIIGGYVLAGEFLRHDCNVVAALVSYENLMMPFVRSQQSDDNAMQVLNPQTWWGIALRNIAFGSVCGLRLDRLVLFVSAKMGWIDGKIPLPVYEWPGAPS